MHTICTTALGKCRTCTIHIMKKSYANLEFFSHWIKIMTHPCNNSCNWILPANMLISSMYRHTPLLLTAQYEAHSEWQQTLIDQASVGYTFPGIWAWWSSLPTLRSWYHSGLFNQAATFPAWIVHCTFEWNWLQSRITSQDNDRQFCFASFWKIFGEHCFHLHHFI